ncbi:MAG TPA: LEPR-XLL domain-containing protein, partial [Burkholderiaceae bacterium]
MKSKHTATRKASVSAILGRLLNRGLGVVSVAAPKPPITSPRRATIALEALEPRLLLSGSPGDLSAGVLTGHLTAESDTVVIGLSTLNGGVAADGGLIIDLSVNGEMQTYGTATSGVHSILLDGGAGDDRFHVATALGKPTTIVGGDGMDTVRGTDAANAWFVSGA